MHLEKEILELYAYIYISKEGLYFVVKKHFEELANKIKGNVKVTYTAKTRLVILISKNIEDIMDK